MGRRLGAAIGLLLALSLAAGAAVAADLQSATAAYQRGDFRAALAEFQELANSGDSHGHDVGRLHVPGGRGHGAGL